MDGAARIDPRWHVVVPVKPLRIAKSRLGRHVGALRTDLALAMAADTVAAAVACSDVRQVIVVTDDADVEGLVSGLGAHVVADEPAAGINPALRHGVADLLEAGDHGGVAALAADLPALRPTDLSIALRTAGRYRQSFVVDTAGSGTTMYAATAGSEFDPQFGPHSAALHALTAIALEVEVPSLRRDVDTLDDLWVAIRMGVGPHTAALQRALPARSA